MVLTQAQMFDELASKLRPAPDAGAQDMRRLKALALRERTATDRMRHSHDTRLGCQAERIVKDHLKDGLRVSVTCNVCGFFFSDVAE